MPTNPLLRALVDLRDRQIQKGRIQFQLRLSAIDRNADDTARSGQRETIEKWFEWFQEAEKAIDKDIKRLVQDEPIYWQATSLKGIGPMLVAKLIAMIDIDKSNTVSALWKYCGVGVGKYWQNEKDEIVAPFEGWKYEKQNVDGKEVKVRVKRKAKPKEGWILVEVRDRCIPEWLSPYNKRLKATVYLIATSFMRSGSPYRQIYDSARDHYARTHSEWTKGHAHWAALRKMAKVFLSHFWARWREAVGLPTRELYVIEKLGHTRKYEAIEFGWPELLRDEDE